LLLMSLGTSKLIHYAFPFLPPVGLAGGYLAAAALDFADAGAEAAGSLWRRWIRPGGWWHRATVGLGPMLLAGAVTAFGLAVWTALRGRVLLEIGGTKVFSNSSAIRPLLLGMLMLGVSGSVRVAARFLVMLAIAALLPLSTYVDKVTRTQRIDHPLRTIRDCAGTLESSRGGPGGGIYVHVFEPLRSHAYYYYFWRLGPWVAADRPWADGLWHRLFTESEQTLVLMARADHERLASKLGVRANPAPRAIDAESGRTALDPPKPVGAELWGVVVHDVVILLPGPYGVCAAPAEAAGARAIRLDVG